MILREQVSAYLFGQCPLDALHQVTVDLCSRLVILQTLFSVVEDFGSAFLIDLDFGVFDFVAFLLHTVAFLVEGPMFELLLSRDLVLLVSIEERLSFIFTSISQVILREGFLFPEEFLEEGEALLTPYLVRRKCTGRVVVLTGKIGDGDGTSIIEFDFDWLTVVLGEREGKTFFLWRSLCLISKFDINTIGNSIGQSKGPLFFRKWEGRYVDWKSCFT